MVLKKRFLGIVHQEHSTSGEVGRILRKKNIWFDLKRPMCGEFISRNLQKYHGLVIFGGPMSANDDHLDGIKRELKLIEQWLILGKPFLAICLGAQLLTRVLGGRVACHRKNEVEMGWYPLYPKPGFFAFLRPLNSVYHWHREGFEVPLGIDVIAENKNGPFVQQAFICNGNCIGTQFHPEMEMRMMKRWLKKSGDMLQLPGAKSQSQHLKGLLRYQKHQSHWLERLIDNWILNDRVI